MVKRWDAMSAKESNGKTYWTRIGVMFENRSGNGFTLSLDAIPVPSDGAYKISLFEPKENNNYGGNNNGSSYGNNSGNDNSGGGFNRPGANRGQQQESVDDEIPF